MTAAAGPETVDPLTALRWLADVGVDDAVLEAPVDRYAEAALRAEQTQARRSAEPPAPARAAPPMAGPARPPRETSALDVASRGEIDATLRPSGDLDRASDRQSARQLAASANTLAELRAALEAFEGCPLKHRAKNLVFADGDPSADLMFVGEAPGRDEDEAGLPFVGVSGKLLDKIAAGIGRDRTSFYITNVLPWRPPDNREPALTEASVCLPFLHRHIALAKPKVIVALGATAAKNLFDTTEGITRLRGKWRDLTVEGHSCPAMATFHPAALLRQPINKRYVWRDMLAVAEKLDSLR